MSGNEALKKQEAHEFIRGSVTHPFSVQEKEGIYVFVLQIGHNRDGSSKSLMAARKLCRHLPHRMM